MAEEPTAVPETPQEAAPPAETVSDKTFTEQAKPVRSADDYEAELAKVRREAASYRVKLKEVEPIAKKALEAEEAEKTEVQKAVERAQAAEKTLQERETDFARMSLAVTYQISDDDDVRMIGSGTRDEMEANAKRIAALNAAAAKATPPPTNQPVEGLRPGASPEPGRPPDDSYPSAWTPSWLRGNDDSRSQYGQ